MTNRIEPRLPQIEKYLEQFRAAFRRRDRLRLAAVYVHGLLAADGRKSVGGLVRHADHSSLPGVEDVTQALQNFVNQSPWDENLVWRCHRELMARQVSASEGILMIEEVAFVKQGRHSVGVQRQYSNVLGGKLNCQIAIALSHAGPEGVCPLALRLYLPRGWVQNPARLEAAGVPETHRSAQSRGTIALSLLKEIVGEGWPMRPVVFGPGFEADDTLRETLLVNGMDESRLLPFMRDWHEQGRREQRTLFDDLGLGEFEGRSWRGFHHHACLVMLASAFRALKRQPERQAVLI